MSQLPVHVFNGVSFGQSAANSRPQLEHRKGNILRRYFIYLIMYIDHLLGSSYFFLQINLTHIAEF